ncbi:MAG: hypothetical protein NT029_18040 [Armatimonadetes bacterium]|nr:hypothetical protein [Armatimonadota bacterium]
MSRAVRALTAAVALFLLCWVAHAGAQVTASMVRDDPRLATRITIRCGRIYLGDLFERASVATGVDVSASTQDGAADIQVLASLRELPLADAMDAAWSLVSYRGYVWRWERSGEAPAYRYRLIRPQAAASLADALEERIQEAFEEQVALLARAGALSPEERNRLAEQAGGAGALLRDPRCVEVTSLFRAICPQGDAAAVLRGSKQLTVPVSKLPEDAQAMVHATFVAAKAKRLTSSGDWEPVPEPTSVTFRAGAFAPMAAASLYMDIEGIGGHGYAGGMPLEAEWARRMADLWRLPGDAGADAAEVRELPPARREGGVDPREPPTTRRLLELSGAVPDSLLARLPVSEMHDPGVPVGRPLSEFLQQLAETPPCLRHKWRRGVLLLAYPSWFRQAEERFSPPWTSVKRLREASRSLPSPLPVAELCAAAAAMGPDHLMALAREFPVMSAVSRWRGVFAGLARLTDRLAVLTGDGRGARYEAPSEVVADGRRPLPEGMAGLRRVVVSIIAKDRQDGRAVVRDMAIRVLAPNGSTLIEEEFYY